ncbi:hypothetical protein GCM10010254_65900 [Streptomyces chromofuscus]|nr:hypothetical protein GCM10010254_65900 [Streptomyces chromofuscus]
MAVFAAAVCAVAFFATAFFVVAFLAVAFFAVAFTGAAVSSGAVACFGTAAFSWWAVVSSAVTFGSEPLEEEVVRGVTGGASWEGQVGRFEARRRIADSGTESQSGRCRAS